MASTLGHGFCSEDANTDLMVRVLGDDSSVRVIGCEDSGSGWTNN